ncbi:uncharacterized protein LOC120347130 [Styela clava]
MMMSDQIILEEDYDENYIPTEDEVNEYAKVIGLDPENDKDLMWIAKEGINAPLPPNWKPCQDVSGDIYYFNFDSGDSIWDHPCDEYYRGMVAMEREKRTKTMVADPPAKKKNKKEGKKKKKADKNKPKPLESSLKPLNPIKGLDKLPGSANLLSPTTKAPSLGSLFGNNIVGGIEDLKPIASPFIGGTLGSSLGSSAEIGRIQVDKLKTMDLEDSVVEYQESEDLESEESEGAVDSMDKMIVSSNSDEANQKTKSKINKTGTEDKEPTVTKQPLPQTIFNKEKETKEVKPEVDSKLHMQKSSDGDHALMLEKIKSTLDSEFEKEKSKLEKDHKEKLEDLKREINEETEDEEAKLKEEQMTALIRLKQKLKSEMGEEEKKIRAEMHENLVKSQTDNEKLEQKKLNDLETAKLKLEKEIAEEKSRIETEKQEKLRSLRSTNEQDISKEKSRLEAEKQEKIKSLRTTHETELERMIKNEEERFANKKKSALKDLKREHAMGVHGEQKKSINEEMEYYEKSSMMEEIHSDKIRIMKADHDKQIREIQERHEEQMRRMRDENDAQSRREKERLRTKIEYEHKVEMNRLEQDLSQKKESLAEKYQTQLSALQNDLDMLNTRRSYLNTQNDEISRLTNRAELKINSLKQKHQSVTEQQDKMSSPRHSKPSTPRHAMKDLDSKLNIEDLVERDIEYQDQSPVKDSFASDPPDDLVQNFFSKKSNQREEDGIRNARDFLHKQRTAARRSAEARSWRSDRKSVSAETQELLKKIQRSYVEQEVGLDQIRGSAEQIYARDRDQQFAAIPNGSNNVAYSAPFTDENRPSGMHMNQPSLDVMQYLKNVDDKLNTVLGLVATKLPEPSQQHPAIPSRSYDFSYQRPPQQWANVPQPAMPVYPSLREAWHNSVSSRVDEELRNMSKYFGYSFESQPPPSVPYHAARELLDSVAPSSLPPRSTRPMNAWGMDQSEPLKLSANGGGLAWLKNSSTPSHDSTSPRSNVKLVIDETTSELKAVPDG